MIFNICLAESQCKSICPVAKVLHPTIKWYGPWDRKADAKNLYRAMKGGGTNEKTIVDILPRRTYQQRNEIANVFYTIYHYNFRRWLFDEISQLFLLTIKALMYQPYDMLASHLLWAVKGAGTKEQTLIDILVPMNGKEMSQVKTSFFYQSSYSLRYYIRDDTDDTGELFNSEQNTFNNEIVANLLNDSIISDVSKIIQASAIKHKML